MISSRRESLQSTRDGGYRVTYEIMVSDRRSPQTSEHTVTAVILPSLRGVLRERGYSRPDIIRLVFVEIFRFVRTQVKDLGRPSYELVFSAEDYARCFEGYDPRRIDLRKWYRVRDERRQRSQRY